METTFFVCDTREAAESKAMNLRQIGYETRIKPVGNEFEVIGRPKTRWEEASTDSAKPKRGQWSRS